MTSYQSFPSPTLPASPLSLPLPARSSNESKPSSYSMEPTEPPPLNFDPWEHKGSIAIGIPSFLLLDAILPCGLYFILKAYTDLSQEWILGVACVSLGLVEIFELLIRAWRLYRNAEVYSPLNQPSRWAFDATTWIWLAAVIVGIIPYVFATDLDDPIEWLFLFAPGIVVACLLPLLVVSLVPFRTPFRLSSDAAGTPCKPIVYHFVEDFLAVDCMQGRGFRERWRARHEASPVMRRLMWWMSAFWAVGSVVFIGLLAGITWGVGNVDFDLAYVLSFVALIVWVGVWSLITWIWTRRTLKIEREWFARRATQAA